MPLILGFLYLFLEVFVSYEVIDIIGVLGFVLEIIITAFFGFFILVNFRLFLGDALMRVRERQLSYEAFVGSNIFRILGAILLILPGALTDIIGILMQFSIVGFMFVKPFIKTMDVNVSQSSKNRQSQSEVIDVEVIEKDGSTK
ncbi:FxsA family protein [Helicobacter turcicus]|uniref:FxsA family protein n=1 Tax=Helicobacter turcicus TaxID=2867412 RepID=A0ABS7JMY2_9HELI|nr:FxsA family protein [Helicobacter turcicus]MBX7490753.1 FxsA family protein [Helicobacter turcicus]MBX7545638.1 FxsA family protein [Helicobacter turcicus]